MPKGRGLGDVAHGERGNFAPLAAFYFLADYNRSEAMDGAILRLAHIAAVFAKQHKPKAGGKRENDNHRRWRV
jgi:hypothetical protein